MDIARQDHQVHALVDALLALDGLKRGKFHMQIRQDQQTHDGNILSTVKTHSLWLGLNLRYALKVLPG
jgi:hypothetical protein